MDSLEQFHEKLSIRHRLERNVFLVLFCQEVRSGFRNPLQKIWIATILFFGLLFTLGSRNLVAISSLLVLFIFFGSVVALIVSSSSISGEIGGIADSLLSKSVKRWEYLLSKFISQMLVVSTVYLLVVLLSVGILWRFTFLPESLDYENLFFVIMLIGLVLLFFSSIGVMFSSIFSRTVVSLMSGVIVWFLLIFLFLATEWECVYSPVEIIEHFLQILEDSWDTEYWKIVLFYAGSPLLFFTVSLIFFYQRDL